MKLFATKTARILWLRWTAVCGIGEFVGIAAAAVIALCTNRFIGEPTTLLTIITIYLAATFSGIIEGGITGYLQATVLSKALGVNMKRWVLLTVAIAVMGWIIGTTPSIINTNQSFSSTQTATATALIDLSFWSILLYAAGLGIVTGALFGLFQTVELRRHVVNSWQWIVANALGWTLAMVIIFIAATTPTILTPLPVVILYGAVAGLLAGLAVGAVTGIPLVNFQRRKTR